MKSGSSVWVEILLSGDGVGGLVTGFRVYFVGIISLFSFILLAYNFLIVLCIGVGYTRHCVDCTFCFC